jgi:hypothetical protein
MSESILSSSFNKAIIYSSFSTHIALYFGFFMPEGTYEPEREGILLTLIRSNM